ncbi:MAG: NYN domain-containing protein [Candidatus Doudnabacteria bacterium]|nr:NYN domain-containing protein [Candidatus Doudnabacteria bacterium]
MDLNAFKLSTLGIHKQELGKVYSFIDFGNVNYWFERDERGGENNDILPEGSKLIVDIEKLGALSKLFSEQSRFYFGLDDKNKKSIHIISKSRRCFDYTGSKPIQWIKHYVTKTEIKSETRSINEDLAGKYIYIPKCNFDVEISVDAQKLMEYYDTFCIWTGDSDFAYLLDYLIKRKKKIILFSSGHITHELKSKANIHINGQQVKKYITRIIEKPRL